MTTGRINRMCVEKQPPLRVNFIYPVELANPLSKKELPFVLGVVADFSGQSNTPLPPLFHRNFLDIDSDNFDTVLAEIAPQLTFSVANKEAGSAVESPLEVDLRFHTLNDFAPDSVAAQVPALAELLERRRTLNQLRAVLEDCERLAVLFSNAMSVASNNAAPTGDHPSIDEFIFRALLSGAPVSEQQLRKLVPVFFSELRAAARPLSSLDPEAFVNQRMRILDRQLSVQVNAIFHSTPFQQLEATWRGLHYLVNQTESGPHVKIRILSMTKKDLRRDLLRASAFDQSIFFKKVHDSIYGSSVGQPFAALILDFAFGPQNEDVHILSELSHVAAAIHAPCIAAASSDMFDLDKFIDFPRAGNLTRLFEGALYAPWRRFRESEESRYIALTLPRILLRLPYGCTGQSVEAFDYEEDIFPSKHHHYLWGNAAYALGTCLASAFAKFGWCAAISGITGGGKVEDLPIHFLDASEEGTIGPTEVTLNEKQEFDLVKLGFLPLSTIKAANQAVFFTAHSCHQPKEFQDLTDTSTARLFTRLDYLLCASRLAHYLRCIFRDHYSPATTSAQWQTHFNKWISQYVLADEGADIYRKARHPLTEARIEVAELQGKPNTYAAIFRFHPHFQLVNPPVGYRLVVTLPQLR